MGVSIPEKAGVGFQLEPSRRGLCKLGTSLQAGGIFFLFYARVSVWILTARPHSGGRVLGNEAIRDRYRSTSQFVLDECGSGDVFGNVASGVWSSYAGTHRRQRPRHF